MSGPGKCSPSTSPHVPEQGLPDCGPTPATLQPDFKQGTYTGAYPALMKSIGMCPSNWRNDLTHNQFMGSSMLLSWDLTPNASNGMAYLYPRLLGTVKASLIFAKPLPTTTPLIAYAQYDNLVFINYYHTVTFDYNTGSFDYGWQLQESLIPEPPGLWSAYTPGMNASPHPPNSQQATSSTWPAMGRGTLGGSLPQRLKVRQVFLSLWDCVVWVHIPMLLGGGLVGLTLQHKNATGPILTVLPSTSWPCTARACHWRLWPVNSRSTNSPAMMPWTNASWDRIYTLTRALDCHYSY